MNAENLFTTKKGNEVGVGNHGMSDEGVRYYKQVREQVRRETKEERLKMLAKWDEVHERKGLDIDWKPRKRKVSERE